MKRPLFIVMTAMVLGEVSAYLGGMISIILDAVIACFLIIGFFFHVFFNMRMEKRAFRVFLLIGGLAFFAGQFLYGYACRSKGIEKTLYGDQIQKSRSLAKEEQRELNLAGDVFAGRDIGQESGRKGEIKATILGVVETVKKNDETVKKTLILKKGAVAAIDNQSRSGPDQPNHLYGKCILTGWTGEVMPGDRIEASGCLLALEEVRNPGQFPMKSYRLAQGIRVCFQADKGKIVSSPLISFRRWAYTIRKIVEEGYEDGFSHEEQALLKAMVLGDKSDLSEEERCLYEENGVAHLLSLSGLHVSIIAGRLFRLMRRRKRSYGSSCIVSAIFIFFYGLIVSGGSSLIRASLMFASFLLAEYLGAEYDMISAMSLAMILMLLESPFRAFEGGCIISFASIFAIGMILPAAQSIMDKRSEYRRIQGAEKEKKEEEGSDYSEGKAKGRPGRLQGGVILDHIKRAFFSGLVISAVTGPVIMMIYCEWSPYSILLNLIIIPSMVPLMLSAVSGACLFLAEYLIRVLLPISMILKTAAVIGCLPAVWIIRAFHWIFTMVRRIPAALVVTGHLEIWQMMIIYGLELLVFMGYYRRKYVMILSTALFLAVTAVIPRRPMLGITMLDIGQGDSILLRCPGRYNILIDSGSSSDREIASYVLKPALKYYGIAYLDGIVISHFDEDHISGIRELLQTGYPIGSLMVGSPGPDDENDDKRRTILDLARKQGIPVHYLARGDRFSLDAVSFTCLNPLPANQARKGRGDLAQGEEVKNEEEDRNAGSVVLYMKWDRFDALFTGDIGQEEEKEILTYLKENCSEAKGKGKEHAQACKGLMDGIRFLKAAHHGSSHSSCMDFLELTRPMITGISAGRKNHYGHPGEQALARLKESGASKIFCTSWAGAICLETDGKTIRAGYASP